MVAWDGLGLAALSAVTNGTFTIPSKLRPVRRADVNPFVFNLYMCVGIVLSCSVSLFALDHIVWTPFGLVSGAFLSISSANAFAAVGFLGISIASGIWCGVAVVLSFLFGLLLDPNMQVHDDHQAVCGICLILVSIFGIALSGHLALANVEDDHDAVSSCAASVVEKAGKDEETGGGGGGGGGGAADGEGKGCGKRTIGGGVMAAASVAVGSWCNREQRRKLAELREKLEEATEPLLQESKVLARNCADEARQLLGAQWGPHSQHLQRPSSSANKAAAADLSSSAQEAAPHSADFVPPSLRAGGEKVTDLEKGEGEEKGQGNEAKGSSTSRGSRSSSTTAGEKLAGVICACLTGAFGGLVLAPMQFAPPLAQGFGFFPSFALGVAISAPLVSLIAVVPRGGGRLSLPSPHFKDAFLPGLLSGLIWNFSNVSAMYAVEKIGYGVAYPIMQCGLFVSGLWGIVCFDEMQRSLARRLYWVSGILLIPGAALLAQSTA
ncbi:hypothetical protein CBR_g36668 [Chara braunii]|uniref:EamA domain-containing protein n=1 Tax=Chara braunii TaxID=69332 RepID=A0A388LLC1_CHABU|nr:hypothetical protein CBR_g36668 [Chara braunii]|eukprot:GBG83051.1 hypothetical protein CBR_g36668 [Chara braunii]